MIKRISYYFSFVKEIAKVSLMYQLAHRLNGIFTLSSSVLRLGTTIIFLQIVFTKTQSLGTWSQEQVFLFYGVYLLCDSIVDMVLAYNLQEIPEAIENGHLDMALTKPINSLFAMSFASYRLLNVGNIIFAGLVIANSISKLNISVTPLSILSFVALIASGLVIYYSIYTLIVTLSFWTIRMQFYEVLESLFSLLRFPLDIFGKTWQIFFTILIPLVFVVTIPAKALMGIFDWLELVAPFVAALLLFLAVKFWNYALRKYSSASS